MADLDKKEHKNWVIVGCALNITKNGITTKIQTEMETWYQSLISSPALQSLTCFCTPRAPKCPSCATWESELTRHHTSKRPKICWGNSDRKQWGSPTGAWEVAKLFMPNLGRRKTDIISAETSDIGDLLNLLQWCPFIKTPVSKSVLISSRDECRNHWAHAPKQELQDADVPAIFGHLNSLLSDPVFTADRAAQKASNDLQDLFCHGVVNVRNSEVEALHLLRQSLVADLTKCQDDLTDLEDKVAQLNAETEKVIRAVCKELLEVREQGDMSSEEIGEIKQQLETKLEEAEAKRRSNISTILRAIDNFNRRLNETDDLGNAFELIRDGVEDVRHGMQNIVVELNATKSQVVNLTTNLASVKRDIQEVASKVVTNQCTISGLKKEVMEVMEEMGTLKGKASEEKKVCDDEMLCTAPSRLASFTGRKSALGWLERNLVWESPKNSSGMSCCTKAICGFGGCGKTSLAAEFSWSYKDAFPGGVFWINGESDENLSKSVEEILALVNTPTSTSDDTLNKFASLLSRKESPWLLVVDNVDDLQDQICPTGVKKICRGPWQRNGNASKHGHILVTTRQNATETRTFLRLSKGDCLELKCFSKEEGTLFLMRRTDFDGEPLDPEAILLAEELGGLPLALEQAAAYISTSPLPLSFKDYLEKYQAVKVHLLKHQPVTGLSLEAQHRLSVHTTWEMNFESVRKQSPAAASMMQIAAFLQSENIPVDVINTGFPELDEEELRECARSKIDVAFILKILASYSLCSVDHQNKVFGVHNLVQEVVRESLTTSQKKAALMAAHRVLHFAFRTYSVPYFKSSEHGNLGNMSEIKEEEITMLNSLVLNFYKVKYHMGMMINDEPNMVHVFYNSEYFDLVQFAIRIMIAYWRNKSNNCNTLKLALYEVLEACFKWGLLSWKMILLGSEVKDLCLSSIWSDKVDVKFLEIKKASEEIQSCLPQMSRSLARLEIALSNVRKPFLN